MEIVERMNNMKRGARIMAILLSITLMMTMAVTVAFADDTAEEESVGLLEGLTVEELSLDEDSIEGDSPLKNAGRKILIAGLDNGGRADLILILCFTTDNKAKIFSVARDTYMQLNPSKKYTVEGKVRDFCKCNRASYDSMSVLMTELNRHLDLDIKEYVGADWDCVATLFENDAVDGLTVTMDANMAAEVNRLITGMGRGNKVTTGTQKLRGWQVVQYLRARKNITPSYNGQDARLREERNRDVFIQLFNQLKNSDKKDLIYNAISGKIKTNMSPTDIKTLYNQFSGISVEPASQYPYSSKIYWDKWADMFYYVPNKTLEANDITLHRNVLGQGSYMPSATVKSLSATIAKHVKKKVIVAKKPSLPSVAKATVTVGAAAYTGKEVKPSVTVKLKKKKLSANVYTVTYNNNVNIGKASVTIEGRYGYGGTKTVYFDIAPAGTSLTGITAGSKSFTATWAQQAALMPNKTIDGYQIQYGLKKNFKGAKTLTVSGYTNTTATVSKLKAKKKYYVRVRTYVGSGKSAVFSGWSSIKVVKPTK